MKRIRLSDKQVGKFTLSDDISDNSVKEDDISTGNKHLEHLKVDSENQNAKNILSSQEELFVKHTVATVMKAVELKTIEEIQGIDDTEIEYSLLEKAIEDDKAKPETRSANKTSSRYKTIIDSIKKINLNKNNFQKLKNKRIKELYPTLNGANIVQLKLPELFEIIADLV